jgi:hypothetical protein
MNILSRDLQVSTDRWDTMYLAMLSCRSLATDNFTAIWVLYLVNCIYGMFRHLTVFLNLSYLLSVWWKVLSLIFPRIYAYADDIL